MVDGVKGPEHISCDAPVGAAGPHCIPPGCPGLMRVAPRSKSLGDRPNVGLVKGAQGPRDRCCGLVGHPRRVATNDPVPRLGENVFRPGMSPRREPLMRFRGGPLCDAGQVW